MKLRVSWLTTATLVIMFTIAAPASWALDFNRSTLEGQSLSLTQFRGRVVVLDFFATWCGPCTQAMPKLKQLQRSYGHAGLSVIGYSVDSEGLSAVSPYAARQGLNFPVVLGNAAEAKRIANVEALPTTLVIGPDGQLVARFEGPIAKGVLEQTIKPYLREGATPAPPEAVVNRRPDGANRFSRVWVTPNMLFQGQLGVFVHAVVDVADMYTQQGLWLSITMTPEKLLANGKTAPNGQPVTKYQRVDEGWRKHFILFLTCDQLPAVTGQGAYRCQLSVLGPQQQVLERSEEFWFANECAAAASGQAQVSRFEEAKPEYSANKGPRKTGMVGRWHWVGEGRIRGAWLNGPTVHDGRSGMFVHVDAKLDGLDVSKGLWLGLDFAQPAADEKTTVAHASSRLVQPVDPNAPGYFVMFVGCDQLPSYVAQGQGAMWVSLLAGPERNVLERSGVFSIDENCAASSARKAEQPSTSAPSVRPSTPAGARDPSTSFSLEPGNWREGY